MQADLSKTAKNISRGSTDVNHMIKAVLFDLGGTLIHGNDSPDLYRAYNRLLRAHGIERTLSDIENAFSGVYKKRVVEKILYGGGSFWAKFNLLLLKKLGVEQGASDLAKCLDREWWDYVDIALYPDVLPLLKELRLRKLKLGVVTNGTESDIDTILKKVGLESFFELKVGIDTFKKVKPDREVFSGCSARLCLLPSEILFVGDSVENDYVGASDAGMNALLLDREDKVKSERLKKIRDLREVIDFI
ncbi:MAG: HAD family hydrolase [Nitrososphaeria archaeon]